MGGNIVDNFALRGNFRVELGNDKLGHVDRVSPIGMSVNKKNASHGGSGQFSQWKPGFLTFTDLTLEGNWHDDTVKKLEAWRKQCKKDPKGGRKQVSVHLIKRSPDGAGADLRSFNFIAACAQSFAESGHDARNPANIKRWTCKIICDRIEVK